jgi:hypothetical protein
VFQIAKCGLLIVISAIVYAAGADIRVAGASDEQTLETQCQKAAASRYETENKGVVVPWDKISGPHAEDVCHRAFDSSQGRSSVKLRWARALIVNGKLEGMDILFEAAVSGDSVAIALLAEIARYGIMGSVDKATAARLLTRAAQLGNSVAKNDLGEMYYSGEGVEKNPATAAEWLNSAGESRTPFGSALLGYMYFNGQGVRRDDVRAVNLFKAAAPGSCLARFGLAVATDENRGGLDHGDLRKSFASVGLQSRYLWVAKDTKCPDELRKAAQTRANEIGYESDQHLARRGVSRGGTASFGEAFNQALEAGAELMATVREGKKRGLITPEMERIAERIGSDFLKAEADEKLKQDQNCLTMGYRGAAVGGGCAR